MRFRLATVATALALAVTSVAALPGSASAGPSRIAWGACDPAVVESVPAAERVKLTCGAVAVPLDHDAPAAGTLPIAVMRRRADDQRRIGTLFVNVGGPGGSGFLYTRVAYQRFAPAVLARFDIVGFDPRGVGRSDPLRCFTSQQQAADLISGSYAVPVTAPEIASTVAATSDYSRLCAANAGPLLGHLATRDVVRDLDLLRSAVGDNKINYVGLSYGTLVGATYAAMYPQRVRSIVLDGSVDPQLRTSDGVEYLRRRAAGFEVALSAMLARCDAGGPKCAFSGGAAAKFTALRDRLRGASLTRADGTELTLSRFTAELVSLLQQPALFGYLASSLQADYDLTRGVRPAAVARTSSAAYLGDDSYFAVNCTDMPFPATLDPAALATDWEAASPTFGRYHAFLEPAQCPSWPAPHAVAYRGPWANRSGQTILVYGNVFDPATQYRFAQRMVSELGNARLVTVDAFGHTILGDSTCTDDLTAAYLIDSRVPASGTVCRPDAEPFA
jgi:pimeloyl-ACP methyl ester carboxylesterase